jgi:hypothetical protein
VKVLDLQCQHGHGFEGWFGSEDDFQNQLARGLVQCPICDDAVITKKLSAPRLNLSGSKDLAVARQPISAVDHSDDAIHSIAASADSTRAEGIKPSQQRELTDPLHALMRNPQFQEAYMQMAKEVLAKTEDVGTDFAREARKIHAGTSKDRGEKGIRGQATRDEALELLDEGIDVMPLLLPKALKGTLQ